MKIASGIPLSSETQKTHMCGGACANSTIGRGRGRSMAPTVSSSAASLEQFFHSPSPGDPVDGDWE